MTLSHLPKRRWLKLGPTSGRPGSKHSGVSMETQQRRTKWGRGMGGVARAWCGPGARGDLPWGGGGNHRTAHRAKRASSDRSGFFRPEGFEAGAGASAGGDGRLGTISAALALSSRNLSNSETEQGPAGMGTGSAATCNPTGEGPFPPLTPPGQAGSSATTQGA